ncbi:MAG TPA: Rne/Rng family ribonuclease [Candidatus Marinimicrobia bacterium]|nr:Rne/Rng family ribonuclease [Candidatus Neomarinimicrobiota bacterium]MDP7329667.1 Rne/Rng family ribonuclease [Candidatus Neomarinimicrobiota bacterium]MDP7436283.1 Rne/Rng family ribonuclease [Candidatus Neomarinimicrobiota bacterium]HJL75424.1 Rne/Rng family ribonuclease [Candidatus Neomarinimicrobiota bacterium]HJM69824.1 Rne/Rng family ribonuclease [Candidatus Neomarinimicrobiota bacterium]|tara:strand:- start:1731 stop:3281 length:1551 start_codon:yes stop_codon:yes gene_type:complete
MKKEIYINESMGETRIAILEDTQLVEVYVEKQEKQRMVGNIYKGKVENVLPGMQAAFVDIGFDVNAFLPFSEIENSDYLMDVDEEDLRNGSNNHRRNNDNIAVDLTTGQDLYVQVIKEPFAGKGPRVTTEVAVPGRMLVLVPEANYIGISKKVWDKYERRRLKKIISSFKQKGFGVIVRTVAEGKSEEVLRNDYEQLKSSWDRLQGKAERTQSPTLVYEDLETASSVIRDLLTSDVEKIVIDSKKLFRKTSRYLEDVSSNMANRLDFYRLKTPLFEGMGIEDELVKLMRPKVWLKSGAYLIIEKTEAMVVVDVNSGRFVGKKQHEDNSLKINLEAAREVARQLRLRDLSGLIVIDFIDMREEANRRKVYYELRKELKKDRAKVAVSPISEFGLLEMTRQRIRLSLIDSMSEECPTCHGSGRIISKDTLITRIDHWLRRYKSKHSDLRLKLLLHPENSDFITKNKKKVLRGLMWQNFVHISIKDSAEVNRDEFRFIRTKDNEDITDHVGLGNQNNSS